MNIPRRGCSRAAYKDKRRSRLLAIAFAGLLGFAARELLRGDNGGAQELAPGVFFRHNQDIGRFGSNSGWVEFDDYVLVLDASFPTGARELLSEIRRRTQKPVRFVFDTHYHGDHSFGNPIYTETGATVVAQEESLALLRERGDQAWAGAAKSRKDMEGLVMKNPSLVFPDRVTFDDGKHRVDLIYTGWGHTRGDAVAYLPKEKILFTGDACVNGPFNFMGDGKTESWIQALEKMQKLDVAVVAPGHGPVAKRDVIETQKQYFVELQRQVGELARQGKSLDEVHTAINIPMFEKWTGQKPSKANVQHVYGEMTGRR